MRSRRLRELKRNSGDKSPNCQANIWVLHPVQETISSNVKACSICSLQLCTLTWCLCCHGRNLQRQEPWMHHVCRVFHKYLHRSDQGTFLMQEHHLKLWGPVRSAHITETFIRVFFFFLPLHIDDLDVLTWSCWGFCHMSCFLRHSFPVIPPDKFYSVTWWYVSVGPLQGLSGYNWRVIKLAFYTGRSSECTGFVFLFCFFNTGNESLWGR